MSESHEEKTDIELLNDIMGMLPDSSAHPDERRKYSLTKDDVLIIFRIAKIASGHQCPFEGIEKTEAETIRTVGSSINRTQKIASVVIVTGLVSGTLALIWKALKLAALNWVKTGGTNG